MDRFFADQIEGEWAYIHSAEEVKHITKVLRAREGLQVETFDGKGDEYIAEIIRIEKSQITLKILEKSNIPRELQTEIIVYQGIPKAQKMELIIQKLTEIGIQRIVPVKFERCVKIIDEKEGKQIDRWSKIAFEACKQAKRTIVPQIDPVMNLDQLQKDLGQNQANILFYEDETQTSLKEALGKLSRPVSSIGIIIGPEGGITKSERNTLAEAGAQSVCLGNRILRTETAAIYGASVVSYELE